MGQACGDPFAVGAHDHGRVRMAHLRGDIQRQRAEHEQVGGEGVACLVGVAEAHAAGLDDALPAVVNGFVSLPRLAAAWMQEHRACTGSRQRTLRQQCAKRTAAHVDRAQAAQRLGAVLHFAIDECPGYVDLVVRLVHGRPLQRDIFGRAHAGAEGKAAALKEISKSPRLGPKVAQWVEQNEGKLNSLPQLRSRGGGGMGHGEPPPPPRRRGPEREAEHPRPNGMPKKTVPCFKTNGLPQGGVPEFDRQLAGQEAGINSMTVAEYIKGREAFTAGTSVRDPNVARNARVGYQNLLQKDALDSLREKGMSFSDAKVESAAIAADKMKTLAALHNPDMVAAGKDKIGDFGDRNINSRIGAQWNKGQRLVELDRAANAVPEAMRGNKMNAKLERCK